MGKDTNQVKQILGEAASGSNTSQKRTYDMGSGGGFGFLFHRLNLKFDDNGKVISVEHETIND